MMLELSFPQGNTLQIINTSYPQRAMAWSVQLKYVTLLFQQGDNVARSGSELVNVSPFKQTWSDEVGICKYKRDRVFHNLLCITYGGADWLLKRSRGKISIHKRILIIKRFYLPRGSKFLSKVVYEPLYFKSNINQAFLFVSCMRCKLTSEALLIKAWMIEREQEGRSSTSNEPLCCHI